MRGFLGLRGRCGFEVEVEAGGGEVVANGAVFAFAFAGAAPLELEAVVLVLTEAGIEEAVTALA